MALDVGSIVTVTRLRLVCPSARDDILEAIVTDAPMEFPKAGIDTEIKVAHFIAQIATETGGLKRLDENLNYTSAQRLIDVFKKKLFPNIAKAQQYVKNPEKLANYVYANKNGNKLSDDGWTYRGSGLIQLTGRGNFAAAGTKLKIDLEKNPELARRADSALAIALAYWTINKISSVAGGATEKDVEAVTKRINPGMIGIAERKAYFKKGLKAFKPPAPLTEAAAALAKAPMNEAMFGLEAAPGMAAPAPTASDLSGAHWTARFPTSRAISDLEAPFSKNVEKFVSALKAAGANVAISATYRPKERAYLMHWAWLIKKGTDPSMVPPMAGVPIVWSHTSLAKSKKAASDMVAAYGMAHPAALNSRHTERRAIDMTISWSGTLTIKRPNGQNKAIDAPRNGSNAGLIAVGQEYGVIKLPSDPPHWSDDGR